MTPTRRYAHKQAKALKQRRLNAQERHVHQQRQAQRDIEALRQALDDLGLPDDLVIELEGRLRAQKKLLGKIFGLMFPTLFGCRSAHELTRTRGWDKNLPSCILAALPKRSWRKRLRKLGYDILCVLWSQMASKSDATRSRWQWTWVWDDTVFRKYGQDLELVGTWSSGQYKRVVHGIDGVLLLVVIGDGTLVVPVDFAVRRPDPTGPGARCRTKLGWAQSMLDASVAALWRRGLELPAPLVVADSWFSDSKLMAHMINTHQGTFLVQGKATYTFYLKDGRKVKGADLVQQDNNWPFRQSLNAPDYRYACLWAKSPTDGEVTVIIVDKPGEERFYLFCVASPVPATRLLRAWSRRHLIEEVFRTLKHLLATDACQVHSEDAYYGHLVLRLMASFVLYLYEPGDLQGARHDGRDDLPCKTPLGQCRLPRVGIIWAFRGVEAGTHVKTHGENCTATSGPCVNGPRPAAKLSDGFCPASYSMSSSATAMALITAKVKRQSATASCCPWTWIPCWAQA